MQSMGFHRPHMVIISKHHLHCGCSVLQLWGLQTGKTVTKAWAWMLVLCRLNSPDDIQQHRILAGHGGAVVGLHQQWPCLGALLKVP